MRPGHHFPYAMLYKEKLLQSRLFTIPIETNKALCTPFPNQRLPNSTALRPEEGNSVKVKFSLSVQNQATGSASCRKLSYSL
jgi:hypothetical protein